MRVLCLWDELSCPAPRCAAVTVSTKWADKKVEVRAVCMHFLASRCRGASACLCGAATQDVQAGPTSVEGDMQCVTLVHLQIQVACSTGGSARDWGVRGVESADAI